MRRVCARGRAKAAAVLDLQLQARRLLPVRTDERRRFPLEQRADGTAARQRARVPAKGAARRRATDRAGARALVPAVGHPDLSLVATGAQVCSAPWESKRRSSSI